MCAITFFSTNKIYMTVEPRNPVQVHGWLVKGLEKMDLMNCPCGKPAMVITADGVHRCLGCGKRFISDARKSNARAKLRSLTPQERIEVLESFCIYCSEETGICKCCVICGAKNSECKCDVQDDQSA